MKSLILSHYLSLFCTLVKHRHTVPIRSILHIECHCVLLWSEECTVNRIQMDDMHMSKNVKWMLSYSKINDTQLMWILSRNSASNAPWKTNCLVNERIVEKKKKYTYNHNRRETIQRNSSHVRFVVVFYVHFFCSDAIFNKEYYYFRVCCT